AALTVRAEFLIAQDQQEHAWLAVESAVSLARDRALAWSDLAGLERLRRHWILVTQGYDAYIEAAKSPTDPRSIDRLEHRALGEWAAIKHGRESGGDAVIEELRSLGLFGVLAKLLALGIYPSGVVTAVPGES